VALKIGDRIRIKKQNSFFFKAEGMEGKIFDIYEDPESYVLDLDNHQLLLQALPTEIEKI